MFINGRMQGNQRLSFLVRCPIERITRAAKGVQQRLFQERPDVTFGLAACRQETVDPNCMDQKDGECPPAIVWRCAGRDPEDFIK